VDGNPGSVDICRNMEMDPSMNEWSEMRAAALQAAATYAQVTKAEGPDFVRLVAAFYTCIDKGIYALDMPVKSKSTTYDEMRKRYWTDRTTSNGTSKKQTSIVALAKEYGLGIGKARSIVFRDCEYSCFGYQPPAGMNGKGT
jgi:hypothetical protein